MTVVLLQPECDAGCVRCDLLSVLTPDAITFRVQSWAVPRLAGENRSRAGRADR